MRRFLGTNILCVCDRSLRSSIPHLTPALFAAGITRFLLHTPRADVFGRAAVTLDLAVTGIPAVRTRVIDR